MLDAMLKNLHNNGGGSYGEGGSASPSPVSVRMLLWRAHRTPLLRPT